MGDVQVVDVVDRLGRVQSPILEPLREVVSLERAVGEAEVVLSAMGVPALAGNHADADPAGRGLGRDAARLVDHLLRGELVVVVLHPSVAAGGHDELTVDGDRGLPGAHAVHGHVGLLRRGRQADLRAVHLDARDELRRRLQVTAGRDGIEHLAVQSTSAWLIDCTSTTGASPETVTVSSSAPTESTRVDRRREAAWQLLALDENRREAGQRERDGVRPGAQVDQQVAPRAVGDADAAALDERRTRRLDGDPGQDAAGVVRHLPGELACALGVDRGGRERQNGQGGEGRVATSHIHPPLTDPCARRTTTFEAADDGTNVSCRQYSASVRRDRGGTTPRRKRAGKQPCLPARENRRPRVDYPRGHGHATRPTSGCWSPTAGTAPGPSGWTLPMEPPKKLVPSMIGSPLMML